MSASKSLSKEATDTRPPALLVTHEEGPYLAPRVLAVHGYEWIELSGEGQVGPYLVVKETMGAVGVPFASITLTDIPRVRPVHRALWDVYCQVKAGDDLRGAVLELAKEYGELRVKRERCGFAFGEHTTRPCYGESLATWTDAIVSTGRLVTLWDLVNAEDEHELEQHIKWEPERKPKRIVWDARDGWDAPGPHFVIAEDSDRASINAQLLRDWPPGPRLSPARAALMLKLNRVLRNSVSPQVVMDARRHQKGFVGGLIPGNLAAAGYLQLYLEVTGQDRSQRCAAPECRWWIRRETGARRLYCNDACQQAAYRWRQAKEGETVTTTVTTPTGRTRRQR
ncbi:MAG: hypothetical protein ACR2NO_07815 [Chloroflexota bacterium]